MSFRRIVAAAAAFLTCVSLTQGQSNPDARVSMRVEGRSLAEIVDYLREESGANIVVMKGKEELVSMELSDVLWTDALDLAAELAGCVVEERTAGVLVVDKPPRVTFVFQNAEIREVIDAISAISGANIIVAPEVGGSLSLRLTDVPWRDALEVAVKTLGFTVVEEKRGIMRVVDPLSLQAQMETRSYQLRFLRPRGAYVPRLQSEFVQGEVKPPTGELKDDFPVIEALRRALSEGGELDYIRAQNVLIVRDTTQVHAGIKDIIDRLDVEPAQVFVDVKFISTTNADLLNLGIDYGDGGPQIGFSGGQIPITIPFNLGGGGFEDSIIAHPNETGPFADPALNAGATIIPDTIFGALNFTSLAGTLRMFQRDTKSQVVQAPKVLALDGREATIFVGETIRYAEAKTEQGQAGGLSLSVTEADSSPVEVGFQLLIIPHIIPGTNMLTMEVIPKETSLSGTGDTNLAPPGFDVFTIGASGLEGSIALPRKRSSTIVTSMKLQSGETAVIGGLTTDVLVESESRVPYLSRIPIIGPMLFKYEDSTNERRSLMVFLTPTIVRSQADTDRLLRQEIERRRIEYGELYEELVFGPGGQLPPPTGVESDLGSIQPFVDGGSDE